MDDFSCGDMRTYNSSPYVPCIAWELTEPPAFYTRESIIMYEISKKIGKPVNLYNLSLKNANETRTTCACIQGVDTII